MPLSILQRIAGGEVGGLRECIDLYGGLVWSMARRRSRTPADAEDATQEIFCEIWRCSARFDESLGSEKAFIATIARRRLIDRLRRSKIEPLADCSPETLEVLPSAVIEPGAATETDSDVEQALQALAALRPEQRQVLELGILQGLSHPEIAARLGMPLGSVKSNMRRGVEAIRANLIPTNAHPDLKPLPKRHMVVRKKRVKVGTIILPHALIPAT